ncbi:hypothetical protein ZYGR_0AD06840 [Zygosaccharomyces rouxii]|uniref:methylated diphthine methylhydrolase n=1 Tax=Zygosaccharomyces rouxii TaxID=4956 RepID=A0A1Q3A778_ZYGRO|nr:hypothetical protein ZYGR_0AD06840 [Zygosaccharomyces rouxii]
MEESRVEFATRTTLPPCALRIFQDKFILVGTYHLDKPTGNRVGSLDIYDDELNLLKSNETYGAILDLKISPFEKELVATAHSTGNVMLWKIKFPYDNGNIELESIVNFQVFEHEVLVTSLHFSPLDANLLLVTATSGESATIDISAQQSTRQISVQGSTRDVVENYGDQFTSSHGLECWIAEFAQLSPLQDVVFTGGDDATIMAHDLRSKDCIWSNSRIHEAGVVALKCSTPTFRSSKPTSIITGSYDDHIRSLDLRMLGDTIYPGRNTPVARKTDLNLGGGVWRFAECPDKNQESDTLLVCRMYNGAAVVNQDKNSDEFSVINHLKKGHDSMCYGGDWCSKFIATCSFYDNSLQRWNP